MYTIQLGSMVLNLEIVVYLLAGLAGVLGIRIKLKDYPERVKVISDAMNTVLLWIVVWKLSLFLFDPSGVIKDWRALIYFSGGVKGMWIASVIAAAFMIYRAVRTGAGMRNAVEWIAIMIYGWFTIFYMVQLIVQDSSRMIHALVMVLSAVLFVITVFRPTAADWNRQATISVLFVIGMSALLLVDYGEFAPGSSDQEAAYGSVESGLKKGQLAPDFQLLDLQGNEASLSDYRGKKVIMNFWASWCPPCRVEMPHMEKIHLDYKDEDVVILSVNLTSTESSADKAGAFVSEHDLTFPVLLDEQGITQQQYKIRAYPTTVFVQSDGIIHERIQGAIDYEGMKRMMQDMK
ncbi:MAG: redoxin domain-containing protein [Candidatus Pristimantibacillus sp.]